MPITYYTELEHRAELDAANKKAMRLAQALCKEKGFECVLGPDGQEFGGRGRYCYGCPSVDDCPLDWKPMPK